jgi:hypothetical protein
MKQTFLTAALSLVISTLSGQKPVKNIIAFSDAVQIDSSDYFLIPILAKIDNNNIYGKSATKTPVGSYSDILFYNSKTNISQKLFPNESVLISPMFASVAYGNSEPSNSYLNLLSTQILYLVRIDDFNNDNTLTLDDPLYLYISTKSGQNLRQITPKGFTVTSWTLSKDKKTLLVKGQIDKNKNGKYEEDDDEIFYRIDLNDDISKIQYSQLSLQ